jgi:DNA-binding HxlR family transcriptional regulator
MEVTKIDNQTDSLKKRIEIFSGQAFKNRKDKGFCITKDIMALLMDKWSLFVIYNLGYFEVLRFGTLKTNIDGISSRMLSVTLKKLEQHHIIERKVFPEVPPRVEYMLTEFGQQLAGKCVDLNQWLLEEYQSNKNTNQAE